MSFSAESYTENKLILGGLRTLTLSIEQRPCQTFDTKAWKWNCNHTSNTTHKPMIYITFVCLLL